VTPANVVTVGPSPLKLFGMVALGGLMVAAGLSGVLLALFGLNWLLSSGWVVAAAAGGVVAGCGGALALAGAVGNRPRVEVGPEGFVLRTLFGSRSRRWADVEGDFEVLKIGLSEWVGYRLTRAFKESARVKPTKLLAGNDEAIVGAYGVPIGELAELLNQHKHRASGAP
jgi:hypothetical protein